MCGIFPRTSALMPGKHDQKRSSPVLLDTLTLQLIAAPLSVTAPEHLSPDRSYWLETEHPLKAKILPTEWLGEHSAELVSDAVNSSADDISHDRAHVIRCHAFDRATYKPIDKLKHDPPPGRKHFQKLPEGKMRRLTVISAKSGRFTPVVKNNRYQRRRLKGEAAHAHAGQWFGERR